MLYAEVFHEFAHEYETILQAYIQVRRGEYPLDSLPLYQTNIKIFYTTPEERDAAYGIRDRLVKDGVAQFVTDQLYVNKKSGAGTQRVPLPKDRIIMKFTPRH